MPPETLWLAGPPAGALLLALGCRPVRRAYAHGWHCVRRFPRIVLIPAIFSCGHILFSSGAAALVVWRATGGAPWPWILSPPQSLPPDLALPALETVAAMLNCLVSAFPLSALFALLFLSNYRGLAVLLGRTLWKRYRAAGLAALAGLVACAMAAALKPAVFLAGFLLGEGAFRAALLNAQYFLNTFSFVFEYLAGACFQLYLMLMAYLWVRGMNFEHGRLMRFAVRRIGFVLKWALVVITASLLGIHLPVAAASLWFPGEGSVWFYETVLAVARPLLALGMLAGAAVQIRLALHNDSLRQALAANARFARRHARPLLLFLGSAFLATWTIFLAPLAAGLWAGSPFDRMASLAQPVCTALLGGWILAAWVCFYQSLGPAAREIEF